MMRKLFQLLLGWPCDHDWERVRNGRYYDERAIRVSRETGHQFDLGGWAVYSCKKCRKSKTVDQ